MIAPSPGEMKSDLILPPTARALRRLGSATVNAVKWQSYRMIQNVKETR